MPSIKVTLVDDHSLIRQGIAAMINGFGDCEVTGQADNGKQLIDQLNNGNIPDIIILDLNMPEMDGMETAQWLSAYYPDLPFLMLTMYDSDLTMIRLLQHGAKGFLKKDIHPSELKLAIESVIQSGFYYSQFLSGKLVSLILSDKTDEWSLQKLLLTEKDLLFIKLSTSELSYKEIAHQMNLNPRTIEMLRAQVFEKLGVESRVGLAIVALRKGLVHG
jgi:two-component system invasion response regulator UvrY